MAAEAKRVGLGRRELLALVPVLVFAQAQWSPPFATGQVVEIRGRIVRVEAGPARGMPVLEVAEGERTWKIWLGSLRYLIENDFNPRAGQQVIIRAFPASSGQNEAWAAAVTLVEMKRTLRLRDELGRPLWRRGPGPSRRGRAGPKTF